MKGRLENQMAVSRKGTTNRKKKGDPERPVTRSRLAEIVSRVREYPDLTAIQLEVPNITHALAQYIASSQSAPIPNEPRELAKRHILDTFVSLVVSARLKPARIAREFALFNGGKADTAHLLTTNRTATLLDAILANAMTAHAAWGMGTLSTGFRKYLYLNSEI
jgi:hypothetical protein